MKNAKFEKESLLLYAVTDRRWLKEGETLYGACRQAINGGVTFLQLREKELDDDAFLKEAIEIKQLADEKGIPFVINDNVDVAIKCHADGVHVGQTDMAAGNVRELIGPDMILGVSAQSVEQAIEAESKGADYLGVGAVFPTGSKDDAETLSPQVLKEICDAVSIPVVAIGGITKDNIVDLKGKGAYGIAVISAIFAEEDIFDACVTLRNKLGQIYPWANIYKPIFAFPEIEGAIFDIDGTILDTMSVWDQAGVRYLESLGYEPEENLGQKLFVMTITMAAEYLKKNYGLSQSIDEIIKGINQVMADYYKNEAQFKPGMEQLLKDMKAAGIKMTVATSTDRHLFEPAMERLDFGKYFDNVYTCTEVGHSKGEPHIFQQAMDFMGTAPEHTWLFEDGLYSAETATKEGVKIVGVYDETSIHDWQKLKNISDKIITFEDEKMQIKTGDITKTALTIAGSDSIGGAGIQADLKTMTVHGVYAMSAITALTAQNTTGVTDIMEVTPEFLEKQLDAVFTDVYPDSVKIGMVASSELIRTIGRKLKEYGAKNIVVDPVMVATSGARLISEEAISVLQEVLLPLATVVTPNIPEAEILSGMKIACPEDMEVAAKLIGDKYGCAVLCKGGHSLNDANDILYANGEFSHFNGKRIDNSNTHGTGCTLSSAIASNLAKGMDLPKATGEAKKFISLALSQMLDLGKGSGPMKHGFNVNSDWDSFDL